MKPPHGKALVILIIDPDTYATEAGVKLTKAELYNIGHDINEDSAHIFGYEGWQTVMPNEDIPGEG